jgi:hypothetical protein
VVVGSSESGNYQNGLDGKENGMTRDEKGRFIKGNGGGPGRPSKEREVLYYDILITAVTTDRWRKIIGKAIEQAIRGDSVARKWLADYLIGAPIQKLEHAGKDGDNLKILVEYVNSPHTATGVSSSASGDTSEPEQV